MSKDVICSNLIKFIPSATLYHFGILESNVHMAWMRAVCGRLKSDYRYSKDVVYNNFPWPTPTAEQKAKIEQSAQAILDARALYPDSSLADLYAPTLMPKELLQAHRQNDRAVMGAYGFPMKMTESECVAELFKRYSELTEQEKACLVFHNNKSLCCKVSQCYATKGFLHQFKAMMYEREITSSKLLPPIRRLSQI